MRQARRYIFHQFKAAQIEQNVSNCTIVQLGKIPEGQLRPLANLAPEKQREARKQAVDTAPEGKVTAAHMAKSTMVDLGKIPERQHFFPLAKLTPREATFSSARPCK